MSEKVMEAWEEKSNWSASVGAGKFQPTDHPPPFLYGLWAKNGFSIFQSKM